VDPSSPGGRAEKVCPTEPAPSPETLRRTLLQYVDRERFLRDHPEVPWERVEAALGASKEMRLVAYTDGASRGNPGKAGIGVSLQYEDGTVLEEIARPIGVATNNEAEYGALIAAVRRARDLGAAHLSLRMDSELVARHLTGKYRVKSPKLLPLYREAIGLLREIPSWDVQAIPREENRDADRLANRGIDQGE
jgi:ribonuclease HI